MRLTQATIITLSLFFVFSGQFGYAQTPVQPPAQIPAQIPVQNSAEAEQKHYQDCMILARKDPQLALSGAKAWVGVGGGFPARHCSLAATMKLGQYDVAAVGFARLAKDIHDDLALKIRLYEQAANAWFVAGAPDQADKISVTILRLDPTHINARMIHAKALGLSGKFWDSAEALTRLLYADPTNAGVLVLRGSAYRQMGAKDLALKDFDQVIARDPQNIEALLERGLIHFQNNHKDKARADWQALIKAHPDDPVRLFAEKYLKNIDQPAKP